MRQCMDADNLHRRLKKIIGQVQAIDRMIDEDIPCEDIFGPDQRRQVRPSTRPAKWYWKGTSSTVSGMAWSTATRTRPSPTSPKRWSGLRI